MKKKYIRRRNPKTKDFVAKGYVEDIFTKSFGKLRVWPDSLPEVMKRGKK